MDISDDNELSGAVIGAAIAIHRQLGPGLREVAYEEALSIRLVRLGVANRRQVSLPLVYKNALLDCGYRLDILVEERLPSELKAVSKLQGIHDAQLLTYLRLGRFPLGLLINFNVAVLKDGIRRKAESRVWEPPTGNNQQSTMGMDRFDAVSRAIVHSAIEVHRQIGPPCSQLALSL